MTNILKLKRIKTHISSGHIDISLDKLLKYTSKRKNYHNELLVLRNRDVNLKKEKIAGIICNNDEKIEKNKITFAILEVTDDLIKEEKSIVVIRRCYSLLFSIIFLLLFAIIKYIGFPTEYSSETAKLQNDLTIRIGKIDSIFTNLDLPKPTAETSSEALTQDYNIIKDVLNCKKREANHILEKALKLGNYINKAYLLLEQQLIDQRKMSKLRLFLYQNYVYDFTRTDVYEKQNLDEGKSGLNYLFNLKFSQSNLDIKDIHIFEINSRSKTTGLSVKHYKDFLPNTYEFKISNHTKIDMFPNNNYNEIQQELSLFIRKVDNSLNDYKISINHMKINYDFDKTKNTSIANN